MAKEKKQETVQVLVRLPRDLHDHVERKVEAANKERKAQLKRPINRQDVITEAVRQDAVKSK